MQLIYRTDMEAYELDTEGLAAFCFPTEFELGALSDAFMLEVKAVAKRQGFDHRWLLAVMDHESNIQASIQNKTSKATGLIQFLPSTAKALGTTVEALAAMDAVTQLAWVEKYLAQWKPLRTATDVAAAVFYPKARGNAGMIIGSKGQKAYDWNARLDRDNKGYITMVDYMRSLYRYGKRWGVEMSDVDGYLAAARAATTLQALLDLTGKILGENPRSQEAQAAFKAFAGTLAKAAGKASGGAQAGPVQDEVDYRQLALAKIRGAFRVQSEFSPTVQDYVKTTVDTAYQVAEKTSEVAKEAASFAKPLALVGAAVAALVLARKVM